MLLQIQMRDADLQLEIIERKRADASLQKAYDEMEQRVKERTAELSRYRDHLEELVEERTAELKTANVHLQREINERMQAEQARRQAMTELEEQRTLSMRSLGEMAAGIAHELNQPLMSVRGLAEHSSDSVHNR